MVLYGSDQQQLQGDFQTIFFLSADSLQVDYDLQTSVMLGRIGNYMCLCEYSCACITTCVWMPVYVDACIYLCVCVCVCVCVHASIHLYT